MSGIKKMSYNLNSKFYNKPFDHWMISDFFDNEVAKQLSKEFIDYNNPTEEIVHYQGWIAEKKACNRWDRFPPETYRAFFNLLSVDFCKQLSDLTGIYPLYPDVGLHGGGWHMHSQGGRLSVHLDYSIHPKLKLQRKLNLIVYLEEDYNPDWGGSLQLWSHDYENKKPLEKVKEIQPLFNNAIIFDTTQKSWHGFPEPINPPVGKMRKSIALYYMTDITSSAEERYRAHYEGV